MVLNHLTLYVAHCEAGKGTLKAAGHQCANRAPPKTRRRSCTPVPQLRGLETELGLLWAQGRYT